MFTGERVIPGAVEPDLWNEHLSRYRFASRFALKKRILDVGCGVGYGADLLAQTASGVIGLDSAADAVSFAAATYRRASFLCASASELPFPEASFELITAFEIIEHLSDWPYLVAEAARVLAPEGVFLVSTPNKGVYAEARGEAGPNPFHFHEFEFDEFHDALARHFSFVRILSQNHQAALMFSDDAEGNAEGDVPPAANIADAQFFVAVCAQHSLNIAPFVFVPSSANLLRERELHIRALQEDLSNTHSQYSSLADAHRAVHRELDTHNAWALGLEQELRRAQKQLDVFTREAASGAEMLTRLSSDLLTARAELARSRATRIRAGMDLQQARADLAIFRSALGETGAELRVAAAEIQAVRASTWIRLGRLLGLGPYAHRVLRFSSTARWLSARAQSLLHISRSLALSLAASTVLLAVVLAMLVLDLLFLFFGRRRASSHTAPKHRNASIVIPNWNGRDILARSLPSLLSAINLENGNEVIVVDNASSDDSVELLREHFPQVKVHALSRNTGFAGGCHAGISVASNEVVVLLNNDMHVAPGFLEPLLRHFTDPLVFAVSSQIFFSDSKRRREETGLTETWWKDGELRVSHRVDADLKVAFPCAYPSGGSSAFDRRKFQELSGFDSLYEPFYYEDTDLGRLAWKRGWKVLYEPTSVVFHEHRGTIGRNFQTEFIGQVVRKNAILYCWKNIHDWRLLLSHVRSSLGKMLGSCSARPAEEGSRAIDILCAARQFSQVCRSRWRALSLQSVSDREAFLRPLGGYFRDRFLASAAATPDRLNVLFVSPYPIEPPIHGGAVFMKETLVALAKIADVHLLSFLDSPDQLKANRKLRSICRTAQFMVRPHFPINKCWTLTPSAVREFGVRDFAWLIHRSLYLLEIDVLQIEYTMMGQYGGGFQNIADVLFEHDISMQSLRRRLAASRFDWDLLLEYCRMRYSEPRILKRFSRIQVCSAENARYLSQTVPSLRTRIDCNVRAAIDLSQYEFVSTSRQPDTLLFVGSFRHSPNLDALRWFTADVFPIILKTRPAATLHIVGSHPPASATIWNEHPNIRLLGTVPDIREALQRFAVFICPILSGSGIRVKLLEAFACGIPSVATMIGAEGLGGKPGEYCELADQPDAFAESVLRLLANPKYGSAMATRARIMVEQERDAREAARRLESIYRAELRSRRTPTISLGHSVIKTHKPPAHSLAEKSKV